ncbi:MAG TPA: glutamine-hydrolyzing carbamoyl-phosphate synthase small subunit [Bacteroidia bacterium]|nr:glutamine-hydrolyzing carbamoyl-phosphate synthase small subunit [Bacteroidia bacterium]
MSSLYPPAILLLEDGKVFHGRACGAIGTTTGELCFNTGMTGYQEIFTDPSYFGQLLVATHVHIGNYGIEDHESESKGIKIAGLICRTFNDIPSRKRAQSSLKKFFTDSGIVAISDIDTRSLVRHLRSKGAMNGIISSEITDIEELKKLLKKVPSMQGLELSSKVTTDKPYEEGAADAKFKVALLDMGVKGNIVKCLTDRGCNVKVYPMSSDLNDITKWKPDGILISNGPGDPGAMPEESATIAQLIETGIPAFGICLGHQLIALANGIETYKMHNGHRGINHPVKNLLTGKCEITSQNHGFAVSEEGIKKSKNVEITHINLNDGTIEGIRMKNKPVFAVQYHPEASPGPEDARYLFDEFVALMEKHKVEAKLETVKS